MVKHSSLGGKQENISFLMQVLNLACAAWGSRRVRFIQRLYHRIFSPCGTCVCPVPSSVQPWQKLHHPQREPSHPGVPGALWGHQDSRVTRIPLALLSTWSFRLSGCNFWLQWVFFKNKILGQAGLQFQVLALTDFFTALKTHEDNISVFMQLLSVVLRCFQECGSRYILLDICSKYPVIYILLLNISTQRKINYCTQHLQAKAGHFLDNYSISAE